MNHVREIAELKGEKQTSKLVYDDSLGGYAVAVFQPIKQFVEVKGEWVQSQRLLTFLGTMDEALVLAQPHLGGEVAVTVFETATKEEAAELSI